MVCHHHLLFLMSFHKVVIWHRLQSVAHPLVAIGQTESRLHLEVFVGGLISPLQIHYSRSIILPLVINEGRFNAVPIIENISGVHQFVGSFKVEKCRVILMTMAHTTGQSNLQHSRLVWITQGISNGKSPFAVQKSRIPLTRLPETLIQHAKIGHRSEHPRRVASGSGVIQA